MAQAVLTDPTTATAYPNREHAIDASYLRRLCTEYDTFFHGYRAAPVLFVDTTTVNYLDNGGQHAALLAQLDGEISGTRAFCTRSESIISLIAEDTRHGI